MDELSQLNTRDTLGKARVILHSLSVSYLPADYSLLDEQTIKLGAGAI
jgi:hypothetical protein